MVILKPQSNMNYDTLYMIKDLLINKKKNTKNSGKSTRRIDSKHLIETMEW